MEHLPEFLLNHPILTGSFVALVVALVWTSIQPRGTTRISPLDATRLISHEDAVVLDVRADAEFRSGHIVNAVHVPVEQLDASVKRLEKYRNRPIIATCRNGQRASTAVKTLKALGFERLYVINGGMSAWETANLPLSKEN